MNLFEVWSLRSLKLRNRIGVAPMCQYSALEGRVTDWHLVHLGARAAGGAALVITEATAVAPEGRISPLDAGLWSDDHVDAWRPVTAFIAGQGAVPAVQLAHAGRKAGTAPPWGGGGPLADAEGGWEPVAPSPLAFREGMRVPRALDASELGDLVGDWAAAAQRARDAGFQAVELHMAHGYLLHQFLSPLSNRRADRFGGSLEDRMRLPLRVARAVREVWPDDLPVLVRISATDWVEGGWDLEQSVVFAKALRDAGVDLVDCSSGGTAPDAAVPAKPGYQVPFAERIRADAGIATAAVGLITEPGQAAEIVVRERADLVLLGRELLRDPHWPQHAAAALGASCEVPRQYARAAPAAPRRGIP